MVVLSSIDYKARRVRAPTRFNYPLLRDGRNVLYIHTCLTILPVFSVLITAFPFLRICFDVVL